MKPAHPPASKLTRLLHLLSREEAWRLPLLAAAIFALLASLWGGLLRMGWQWPVLQPVLVGMHGPLIISGFFGTVIGLERAVALRLRWTYLGPLMTGVGGILLLAGVRSSLPALLLTAGSFWLVLVFGLILKRHLTSYTLVMGLGAAAWAAGSALWLSGLPVYRIVLWWAAFLILTIAGERLELGRLVRKKPYVNSLFWLGIALFLAGLAASLLAPDFGVRLASAGLIGLAAWLLRYDIARKTIRQSGLPRFAAICLLSGYAWLGAGGAIGLFAGAQAAGFYYDAYLHTLFLGFVFSMIFAHAPIIFPAILGLPVRYSALSYLPLALLHASLLVRVAGDLLLLPQFRALGGLLNGAAILLFLILTARSVAGSLLEQRKPPAQSSPGPVLSQAQIEAESQQPWIRRMWTGSLFALVLAGLTGSLMRFWMAGGLPAGIDFSNVRHAHSHLMYFGWAAPALMLLIAARLPALTGHRLSKGMRRSIGAVLILGLLSYLPFFLWGYTSAPVAGTRLPISIILSSLNILAWYAFAAAYRRSTAQVRFSRPLRLWNAALVFLLISSLGAWSRALLSALKIDDPLASALSVHLFLDMFTFGWAAVGLLGVMYASSPRLARQHSGWEDPLLFAGLPLSFILGVPVDLVPADLRTLAGMGGLLAALGLALHARKLWKELPASSWTVPLVFLIASAGMTAAASITPAARWGETAGLRLLFLHVLLLGFVTSALLAGGAGAWGRLPRRFLFAFHLGTIGLLASLIPLTRLWPLAWSGAWQLWAAFIFSLGPVLPILAYLLLSLPRKGRQARGQQEHPHVLEEAA